MANKNSVLEIKKTSRVEADLFADDKDGTSGESGAREGLSSLDQPSEIAVMSAVMGMPAEVLFSYSDERAAEEFIIAKEKQQQQQKEQEQVKQQRLGVVSVGQTISIGQVKERSASGFEEKNEEKEKSSPGVVNNRVIVGKVNADKAVLMNSKKGHPQEGIVKESIKIANHAVTKLRGERIITISNNEEIMSAMVANKTKDAAVDEDLIATKEVAAQEFCVEELVVQEVAVQEAALNGDVVVTTTTVQEMAESAATSSEVFQRDISADGEALKDKGQLRINIEREALGSPEVPVASNAEKQVAVNDLNASLDGDDYEFNSNQREASVVTNTANAGKKQATINSDHPAEVLILKPEDIQAARDSGTSLVTLLRHTTAEEAKKREESSYGHKFKKINEQITRATFGKENRANIVEDHSLFGALLASLSKWIAKVQPETEAALVNDADLDNDDEWTLSR